MKKKKQIKKLSNQIKEVSEKLQNVPRVVPQLISSGSTLFDLALGGGFPLGAMSNIVGEASTGKTLLILEMISNAVHKFKNDFVWLYDDVESGMFFDTETLFGFSCGEENLLSSDTVERFNYNFTNFLETISPNQKGVYVIDSLDMLSCNEFLKRSEEERKTMKEGKVFEKGTMGQGKTKYLSSSFFNQQSRNLDQTKCLLFIVSQVRSNIGGMGPKFIRSGGNAMNHQAAQVVWLTKTEPHMKKGVRVGETIKIKLTKNKIGKPFRECFLNILYDYGIDNISSNIDFLFDLKTDRGKTRPFRNIEWNGLKFKKRESLIKHIEENNQERELEKAVKRKWRLLEERVSPAHRKRKF